MQTVDSEHRAFAAAVFQQQQDTHYMHGGLQRGCVMQVLHTMQFSMLTKLPGLCTTTVHSITPPVALLLYAAVTTDCRGCGRKACHRCPLLHVRPH
jgi:hypothetical protein